MIKGYSEEEKEEWKKKISEKTKEAMQRPEVREKFLEKVQNKNEEWKKHISESLIGRKGNPLSEEQKEKLRKINIGNKYGIGNKSKTGQHLSEETKQKISNTLKDVEHTEEWNKKISIALRGRPKSEEHKQKLKKPKPKYRWQLPDGSIRIMAAGNGARHKDWIKLNKIDEI